MTCVMVNENFGDRLNVTSKDNADPTNEVALEIYVPMRALERAAAKNV